VKETTTANVIQSCVGRHRHQTFYTTFQRVVGVTKRLKDFGPKNIGDGSIINAFNHISDIRFITISQLYTDGTNILNETGTKFDLFKNGIFGHNGVSTSSHLSKYLRDYLLI